MFIEGPIPSTAEGMRAALQKFVEEADDDFLAEFFEQSIPYLLPPPPRREGEPAYGTEKFWAEIERRDKEMLDNPTASLSWEEVKAMLHPDYQGRKKAA